MNGVLTQLTSDQVHMLLCSLRLSYQTGLEFDCRPGLKFLVQKVAQLPKAANLYKQAGAAWSMIALTLFELCLARLDSAEIKAEEIKEALESQRRNRNTHQFSSVQDHEVSRDGAALPGLASNNAFFIDLHNLFLDICELYVDILVDKHGHHSKLDNMSKQQLYFLTIEPDDFHDLVQKPTQAKGPQSESASSRGSPASTRRSLASEAASESTKAEAKPFQFSDFASQPIRPESPNVSEDSDIRVSPTTSTASTGQMTKTSKPEAGGAEDEVDEEVFRVATQNEMDSMMNEYRYRKGKRTLPSTSSKETPPTSASAEASRKNPFLAKPKASTSSVTTNADPEIANQQKESLMADSDAQMAVWTELVLVFFNLSSSLEDNKFQLFLPLLFPGVKVLTAYARDAELKQQIADFFQRVASIYGFNPEL